MDIETLPIPRPKANEVLLRTRACGVCHTDLHVILGHIGFPSPCIMGHEVSGEVVELGPGTDAHVAKRVPIGAKAVVPFIMPCGSCGFCARGKEDICETFFEYNRLKGTLYDGQTRVFRNDGTPIHMYSMGGLAEYCVAPATAVFPISDAIPFAEASIIGCAVFTAYGAMRNAAELQAGENVAVLGTGGVGANCLQIARAFGADRIIAVDVTDDKLAAMRALGATDTINASRENVADRIREVTRGRGVDVCVEALGNPKTFATAVNAVCDGGRAVMVGIAPAGTMAPVEITRIVRREIQIRGSYGARARTDVPAILRLIEKGQVDIVKPITQRFALDQAVRAYTELDAGRIVGRAIIDMKL